MFSAPQGDARDGLEVCLGTQIAGVEPTTHQEEWAGREGRARFDAGST